MSLNKHQKLIKYIITIITTTTTTTTTSTPHPSDCHSLLSVHGRIVRHPESVLLSTLSKPRHLQAENQRGEGGVILQVGFERSSSWSMTPERQMPL
jgi:hypothetical protein